MTLMEAQIQLGKKLFFQVEKLRYKTVKKTQSYGARIIGIEKMIVFVEVFYGFYDV